MNKPDELAALSLQEWRACIEPMLPLGELTSLTSDRSDPQLRQEMYRYLFSQFAAAYFGLVHADASHPDFWPYVNGAFNALGPNPDFMYYLTPLDGNGVYRISGFRGSVRLVDFQIGGGTFLPLGSGKLGATFADYDIDTLDIAADGAFEVVLSGERPTGYQGNWWALNPEATYVMVRQVACDWLQEVDARLAIERLDTSAIKPRPTAAQIEANLKKISAWAENYARLSHQWLGGFRAKGLVNKVSVRDISDVGGVSTQKYIEGLFELGDDEALIYETEVPEQARYWNIQLSDMLWGAIDYVNRQTSLNGHTAHLDGDGRFRAVICATDPGVPNWLDTAGYKAGGLIGRWRECSSEPTPEITKIKLVDLRKHLPPDTPSVSAEARDAALRLRRKGAQLRRRW